MTVAFWLVFIYYLAGTSISLQSAPTYMEDWPAVGRVRRQILRHRTIHLHGRYRLNPDQQVQFNEFITGVFNFFSSFFYSTPQDPSENNLTSTIHESTSLASIDGPPTDTQKTCEICLRTVELSNCLRCCSNRHDLHIKCFADLLRSANRAVHKCPLCRESLIADPAQFRNRVIQTDPVELPLKWAAVLGHFEIFKMVKASDLAAQDWSNAFYHILTKSKADHLRAFLDLNLIDINHTFPNRECALSALFHGVYYYHLEYQRVARLQGNLQVLLSYPGIILNRYVGFETPRRHLIYRAIDANLFDAFLHILEASPQLNLAPIFRYVCEISNRELFFNYLLTCKSFNLFEKDEFNCSALHIAVRNGHTPYALALLHSEEITPADLLARDLRNGRTVLHTAMVSSLDEVVDKLTSTYSDIDWDMQDYSGISIVKLYENRMF